MLHSILIPHRNRNDRLSLCIDSLEHSARLCGRDDWEAVVIDSHSRTAPQARTLGEHVRVVEDNQSGKLYNKAAALNLGIDSSDGRVITIIDADAIVGDYFMGHPEKTFTLGFHRVCYRVRKVALDAVQSSTRDQLFAAYDTLPLAFEAYDRWDRSRPPENATVQPWGNSQFSIARDILGDTRYDERYEGRGFEDLDLNMRLWKKLGDSYRGCIFTDGCDAMVHINSDIADPAWLDADAESRSAVRYMQKRQAILTQMQAEVAV